MTVHTADCELCSGDGGEILHRAEKFRVVLVDDAQYPGFCRVIWNDHVKNMTPHLHWHVIPRYPDDAHFPSPVWAESQRQPAPASLIQRQALLGALRSAISEQF
jgi:diadenosine tetraphosphate (Ap4A) HIT family hydrolase